MEYYYILFWNEEKEPFNEMVNGNKKFDFWMEVPRNIRSKIIKLYLKLLKRQFKTDT